MEGKIKIGMVSDSFYPTMNGITKVSDNLTNALNKHEGVEKAFLICPGNFKNQKFDYEVFPCKAIQLPFAGDGFSFVAFDRKFKKRIKEEDVDVYHCQTISTLFSFVKKVARKKHKPLIVTVNTLYHYEVKMYVKFKLLSKLVTKIVTNIYNSADEVWAINEGVKDYLVSFGIDAKKIRILNNGCNFRKVENLEERKERFNKQFNITQDVPVFCFIGRLYKYKNIFFILDSLIELHKRGFDFRMVYCGANGTDRKKLIRLIKKNGLSDKIYVFSNLENEAVKDIYARSNLQLFPSVYDTDGLVKYEASCYETPTLLLKNSLASIGVQDNVSGFIAENSVQAYTDRIIEILNNKELLDRVSENCASVLIKTWDDIADNAVNLYHQTIKDYNNKNNLGEKYDK